MRRRLGAPLGAAFAFLLLAAAPWRIVDTDSLSRLAVGRHLARSVAASGVLPSGPDPFVFGDKPARWENPEWLSDVLWHGAFTAGGEPLVVLWTLTLVLLGGGLAYRWALVRGAPPGTTLAALALTLPFVGERLVARGELHALWALPLVALLASCARRLGPRSSALVLLAVVPLCAFVWSGLHGSFVLVTIPLGAAAVGALLDGRRREAGVASASLALCLLVPLCGPLGSGAYDQLADHLRGAATYQTWIREWQPPWRAGGAASLGALSLLTALALTGTALRWRRGGGNRGELTASSFRLTAALALAWSAQRLGILLVPLALPELSLALSRLLGPADTPGRARRWTLTAAAALATALTIATARLAPRPPLLPLASAERALCAALERSRHGTTPLRVFAPFDRGPLLLFCTSAPRGLQLYIDPRNTRGAGALARYAELLLTTPDAFAHEVRRLRIGAVVVEPDDERQRLLARYLARSPRWHVVAHHRPLALYLRR